MMQCYSVDSHFV